MERHFVATVYIIDKKRVLLIKHRKLNKWLPPGGHIDPHETPAQAAKREAFEETGIEIEFLKQENIWINQSNAQSFERPYLCLLEDIPAYKDVPAHQHMDFIYVAKPVGGVENPNFAEVDALHWFTLDEINKFTPDQEIFQETQEVINNIMLKPENKK